MGDFAVNVAVACQIGAPRADYSILSAMKIRDDELFDTFGRSINEPDTVPSPGNQDYRIEN